MIPACANLQPAAVGYCRAADGTYLAYGVVVLSMSGAGIARIVSFGAPALVAAFGFPPVLPVRWRRWVTTTGNSE